MNTILLALPQLFWELIIVVLIVLYIRFMLKSTEK